MEAYDRYFTTLKLDKSPNTFSMYRLTLEKFIKYFNIQSIEDVEKLTGDNIQDYLNILADQNKERIAGESDEIRKKELADSAKASANAYGRIIKAWFNWLVSKKYIKEHPYTRDIKKFKEARTSKVFFNKEERDNIIYACRKKLWLQVTISLLFYTGLRRSEIINLKRSDFYGDYVLAHRKGNKEQKLYFPSFVGGLIQKYLDKRKDESEYLLVGLKTHDQISDIALNGRVKLACNLAGIEEKIIAKVGAHTIRRSFACILFIDGWSSFAIQEALGHSRIATTELYIEPAKAFVAGQAMKSQASPSWYEEEDDE